MLAALLLAGCKEQEPAPRDEEVIVVPDPEEGLWDIRFDPPADFAWRRELVPIDSRGKVWRAPGIPDFGVTLDSYAGTPPRCTGANCRSWREPLSGKMATIVRDAWARPEEGVRHSLNVHVPLIERRGVVTLALTIMASCATRAACDRALAVARTVRVVRRSAP